MSATTAAAELLSPLDETAQRIRARLSRPMPTDRLMGWLLPLAITLVGGVMRLWHITRPPGSHLSSGGLIFDETYYAHDSWSLLHHGVELDDTDSGPGFVVHPPLGKWMIAVGEWLFSGNKSVIVGGHHYPASTLSFRVSAAVVGTLAILMTARIARRLFRSTLLGCIAGLLLMFDGLEFVQSRVAMLDIFLMFWVLAAFGCLVLDRDWARARLSERLSAPLAGDDRGPRLGLRPWRLATAFCLGAALATKWDGLFWVPAFLVLSVAWDCGARRAAGAAKPIRAALLRDAWPALLAFVAIPVVVYVVSWTGWFLSDGAHAYDHDKYVVAGQSWFAHDWAVVRGWWAYHREIYHFHATLDSAHPYLSRPYGWLLLARPVAYFYDGSGHSCGASSCSAEVLGVGTPAIWWASILAFVTLGWQWIARRDWRAAAILVSFAAGYLPWFYEDAHHRTMFLFYLLPSVPFMVLAVTMSLGLVLGRARGGTRRIVGAGLVGVYLIVVIGNFAWLRPVLMADNLSYSQWHERMLFDESTCDQSKHRNEKHENAPCWI